MERRWLYPPPRPTLLNVARKILKFINRKVKNSNILGGRNSLQLGDMARLVGAVGLMPGKNKP